MAGKLRVDVLGYQCVQVQSVQNTNCSSVRSDRSLLFRVYQTFFVLACMASGTARELDKVKEIIDSAPFSEEQHQWLSHHLVRDGTSSSGSTSATAERQFSYLYAA